MRLRPNAAKLFAAQIEDSASKIYRKLEAKSLNARKSGVTSDDLSEAMMPFLKKVEQLFELPNSTAVAFDLFIALENYSYGGLGSMKAERNGERPSDVEVDELLVELARQRRTTEPHWKFVEVLERLKAQAKDLADYGIEDFCSDMIKLLTEWKELLPVDAKVNGPT